MPYITSLKLGDQLIIDDKTIITKIDKNKLSISTVKGKSQAKIVKRANHEYK